MYEKCSYYWYFEGLQNLTMYKDNIKRLRVELKLSALALAEATGVNKMTISNYETGKRKPSYEFMQALNTLYNVNLNWFVSGQGEMFNAPHTEQAQTELAQLVSKLVDERLKDKGVI